jgi:DNA-binding beta-propeller fold protein YncE
MSQADQLTYRAEEGWAKIPPGKAFRQAVSIAIDKNDNVFALNRSDNPVMIFDRKGNFLSSWGQGAFVRPHGIHIGPDDSIYLSDDGDHTVRKYTLEGKLLLTIGTSGRHSPAYGGQPFNRCTHTALSPENDIYVSDGYANARVHKYSPEGKLITSWGEPGVQPGQFNIPHNVCCDAAGFVYVADRENHRIQVFDGNGKYQAQWNNLHRPAWISLKPESEPLFYVAELPPDMEVNRDAPNLGPRISIMTSQGKFVSQIHTKPGPGPLPTPFAVPHGIVVDSHGDVYIADLAQRVWARNHPTLPEPAGFETLKKLVRVG